MTVQFFSNSLRREVTVHAIVPVDQYSPSNGTTLNGAAPFKSLYLLHGFHGSGTDWLYNTQIRDLAAQHNIAVFLPSGENHFYVDDVEKNELFGQFIGDELVAFTRAMFPLSTKREDTFIGGLSMGGYGALRNGLKYNNQFGKVIALSSALVTYRMLEPELQNNDGIVPPSYFPRVFGQVEQLRGSDRDLEALVAGILERQDEMPELYLCCGDQDFLLDVNVRFHQYLDSIGVAHVYEQTPGVHDWDYWRKHIATGLKWALSS